jgi:hypothetical protein
VGGNVRGAVGGGCGFGNEGHGCEVAEDAVCVLSAADSWKDERGGGASRGLLDLG